MTRSAYVSAAAVVAWRNLHHFFTNPALLVPAVMFPLFFFTAFAGGLSSIGDVPGFDFAPGYTAFQFVFVLLQSAAFGGVFAGFGMAADFESGFGRRMLLATRRRTAIIAGYAVSALVRAVFIGALLFGIALIVGMDVQGAAVDLAGLIGLALVVNLGAAMFAFGVALRLRSLQAGPLMQTPVFLALFVAPVYVPVDLLQGWIEGVAEVNPVTQLLEAGRGFIAGEPSDVGLAFALAAALAAAFGAWALRGLKSAERAGA